MDLPKLIQERYAVKQFNTKQVSEEKLHELLEFIRMAPSSFNIQPWKIKIISDQKTKDLLAPAAWNQQQIPTCSHLLVFCADTHISKLIDQLEAGILATGAPEKSIEAYIQMMRNFDNGMSLETKRAWAQRQLYIALENALLGATYLGFDACPMEGFTPGEFSRILDIPEHLVPTVLCAVGHAADKPTPKFRFKKEDIVF